MRRAKLREQWHQTVCLARHTAPASKIKNPFMEAKTEANVVPFTRESSDFVLNMLCGKPK